MKPLKHSNKRLSTTKLAVGIAAAMIGGYAGRIHAGSCTPTSPSFCSGAANNVVDVTQSPASSGGELTVTTNAGFGLDTTTKGGEGIYLFASGKGGDTNITFTDTKSSPITSSTHAVHTYNASTGSTDITTSGTLTGGFTGIYGHTSGDATNLFITTNGNVTGEFDGIYAESYSLNSTISITTASGTTVKGSISSGVLAYSKYQAISINAKGNIEAGNDGIDVHLNQPPTGRVPITITTDGSIVSTGDGIDVEHDSGSPSDITVTTNGPITAKGGGGKGGKGGADGIEIDVGNTTGTDNVVVTVNNTITAASDGVDVNMDKGNIKITHSSMNVGEEGINADVEEGNIEIITNGAIEAGNEGIDIGVGTSGDVTITTTANIQAVQEGIEVDSDGGNILIALGGDVTSTDDDGVDVDLDASTPKTVTITGTGNIMGGTGAGDDGIEIVTNHGVMVDVNGVVSGDPGIVITSVTGPISITGTGNVNSDPGNGIEARISGKGGSENITIARDGVITAKGAGNGIVADNVASGDNNITVNQAINPDTGVGIVSNTIGGKSLITLNSGAAVSKGILNNAGDSTTTVNTGASISGDIVLNDGSDSLTFAGGDFSGVTRFDGGDDIATADGFTDILTFQGSSGDLVGANVTNWESVVIDTGSTIKITDNAITVGSLTNGGTLTTQDGVADDVLTITGDYIGNGGTLALDVQLDNGAVVVSDKLVVRGDSSGNTVLDITNIAGTGAQTVGDGILFVEVQGTSSGTFSLASSVQVGGFGYQLVKVGNNWSLQSSPVPVTPPANIPTLSQWLQYLLMLSLVLLGSKARLLRKFRVANSRRKL